MPCNWRFIWPACTAAVPPLQLWLTTALVYLANLVLQGLSSTIRGLNNFMKRKRYERSNSSASPKRNENPISKPAVTNFGKTFK